MSVADLIEAYALGDMLMDVDFKDAVTDAMIAGSLTPDNEVYYVPATSDRIKLYDKTAPGAKIRQALVHLMATKGATRLVEEQDHPAFLVDVAKKLGEELKGGKDESVLVATAKCKYHEHKEGDENCYRTKYAKATFLG
ncbi:uncharacterized protein MYCFIDRAFT_199058 [Pseudocercospora fijiensis CIRAD86]|uniref:Uncharacterized protein n=1 Tax=Pseudocercospora fijiensis (strain CIRAD86) TaxID=383855 RepID=M3AP74_PSEFD|nr:uncharacterized protein MYCFIDRAFT_199058 [Pseudocercospora fijiensis CIRAD86]EME79232.1 hypothetical protein MYCFIDRAFT_199058 [Pseudocercospora fijiensis CIRAD86]